MANIDWPSGLRPVSNGIAGTAPRMKPYPKLAGIIYEGDMLYMGEGGVVVYNGTTDAHADNIVGVAAHYVGTAAATGEAVWVYDDPAQEFICQCDGADITVVADANASLLRHAPVVYATGNTTTLQSKVEIDSSGITSVWTLDTPLLIVRKWEASDNAYGANYKFVVKIDNKNHIVTNDSITRIT
jgi:hypothetical protein